MNVAHLGGFEPEATVSTVEMRSALIGETCRLLQITIVELENSHALIAGHLSSYSVDLDSAVFTANREDLYALFPSIPSIAIASFYLLRTMTPKRRKWLLRCYCWHAIAKLKTQQF